MPVDFAPEEECLECGNDSQGILFCEDCDGCDQCCECDPPSLSSR